MVKRKQKLQTVADGLCGQSSTREETMADVLRGQSIRREETVTDGLRGQSFSRVKTRAYVLRGQSSSREKPMPDVVRGQSSDREKTKADVLRGQSSGREKPMPDVVRGESSSREKPMPDVVRGQSSGREKIKADVLRGQSFSREETVANVLHGLSVSREGPVADVVRGQSFSRGEAVADMLCDQSSSCEDTDSEPDMLERAIAIATHIPTSSDSGNAPTRRIGRGCGIGLKQWGSGIKANVLFDESGHPVGKRASQLKSSLGQLVRNGTLFPLTYLKWEDIPKESKDYLWREVQENLTMVPSEFKDVCFSLCGKIWRSHKSKTKSLYFNPCKDNPSILSITPPGIVEEQWKQMVLYWLSNRGKAISLRQAQSQAIMDRCHTTGRTDISQLRYMIQQEGGSADMARKKKGKKGTGPCQVELTDKGIPVGEHSLRLIYAINSVVTNCDIFPPYESWVEQKEAGRVEELWKDLKKPWGLPNRAATKKWFNLRANRIWSDHKSRVLKPHYLAAEGDFQKAILNRPTTLIGAENWNKLCKKFAKSDDPGDDPNGKSKSQKCKEARGCNQMNHSLGRTSLEYWAHKHFQLYGKYPSVVEFYKKTYMHVDPTEIASASSQSNQSEVLEQSAGVSMNLKASRILEELKKAYEEAIDNGVDEETADEMALLKALGKTTRFHKVITSKATKEASKRKRVSNKKIVEIDDLKEKLEQEIIVRQKLEHKLKLQEEKRQKTDKQLQQLITHLGLNNLMLPPSSSENEHLSNHHTIISDPSAEDEASD